MDSYGVVTLGDHLLSLPGLAFYMVMLVLGLALVGRLTDGIPQRYRMFNFFMYGLCMIAIISWGFIALGWGFYVEA